ncbi:hypothetical protein L208DRAFT_1244452, partial [Tricholoma matsutake]
LDLPSAKTASAGEIQLVYLVKQQVLCPLEALRNLENVVPAGLGHLLFSWMDKKGDIWPMVRDIALERINSIIMSWGWGTMFGHSFRIGGDSFYLAQEASPEILESLEDGNL